MARLWNSERLIVRVGTARWPSASSLCIPSSDVNSPSAICDVESRGDLISGSDILNLLFGLSILLVYTFIKIDLWQVRDRFGSGHSQWGAEHSHHGSGFSVRLIDKVNLCC